MALELNLSFFDDLEDAAFRALEKTADALLGDVKAADIMPRRVGQLEDETYVEPDRSNNQVRIVTPKEYARRLYTHPEYEFNPRKNPNAQGEWLEPWISGSDKERPAELFREFLKQEAKL